MSRCIVHGCTNPPTHTITFTYHPDPDQPTEYTLVGHACADHKDIPGRIDNRSPRTPTVLSEYTPLGPETVQRHTHLLVDPADGVPFSLDFDQHTLAEPIRLTERR